MDKLRLIGKLRLLAKLKLMAKRADGQAEVGAIVDAHESAAGLENAKNKGPDSIMLSGPLF